MSEVKISESVLRGLVEFCRLPEIQAATDGAFDPDAYLVEADKALQAARAGGEPVGFIPSSGLNNLAAGHPAKVYPADAMPSPFESHKLIYTHPPAKVPEGWLVRRVDDRITVQHPDFGGYCAAKEPFAEGSQIAPVILYHLADALLAAPKPAATPEAEWIKCSERLPTMRDADAYGQVIGWDRDNKESVIGPPCDFKNAPWLTHWMPTGLTDPNPPQQEGE